MTDHDKREQGRTVITEDASRQLLAALGRLTGGLSPQAFGGAWLNVMSRLALSPGRQAQLAQSMLLKSIALAQFAVTDV
jgi:polyhydroxyalkanoate synthase